MIPLFDWYERRWGRARLLQVVRGLPPRAAIFEPDEPHCGVLASSWYPAAPVHALLEGLHGSLSAEERPTFAREAGREIIAATLHGVYRWLFRAMLTPERYARNAQRLFARFYDTGVVEKQILGPGHHRTTLREWRAHHPLICDAYPATVEYIYAELGCLDVRAVRTACVDDGAPACVFESTWQA